MRFKNTIFFTTAATIALASVPAMAQESDVSNEANVGSEEDDDAIIVTGTRIRLPNLEGNEPTLSIDKAFIDQRNFINAADALNDLPQIRGSVTPDGGQNAFGQGVNFINNFSLGSNRTLTLVNGRRVVSSNTPSTFGQAGSGVQVDINTIPTALIKRVDIVSTAGAPVYGSDAIAGTVNFILDDKYEGFSLNATSSITEEGDNFEYRFEGVYGTSFAEGRGHLQISAFYTDSDGVRNSQRDFFREERESRNNTTSVNRFNPNLGTLVGGAVDPTQPTTPANAFFRDVRIAQLSNTGVIFGGPIGIGFSAQATDTVFGFNEAGDLVPFNPGVNIEPVRNTGGDGFQFSDFAQLTSDLRRFSTSVYANYDVTDSINVYVEGQYFDSRADELVQQPTFNTPLFGGASSGLTFQDDNPFLNDQARGVLAANGVTSFTISRANVSIADLTGFAETERLRGVLGARGKFKLFNNDWNWDVSFNYGQTDITDTRTNVNSQNFINAVNVTTDAAGNIICDVMPANPAQAGLLPVADPNCVPFNFFGNQASPEAIAYVTDISTASSILEQVVFNINVGGTIFELFNNPVAVNIGYEHRNEQGIFTPSQFDQNGLGRGAAVPAVNGEFNLEEFFGELYVPVITPSNDSFIHSLTLFGRGRFVDNTVNGSFTAFAGGGSIAPIEDIEIRGNFTRSFRAPAITELFAPQGNAFATVPDLCEVGEIDAGPNPVARERNCNAFLAAFPGISRPQLAQGATVPILNGGNPNLDNERADSFTAGVILRPRYIPNLSITADYINISISDPITTLTVAAINAACFDNDNFDVSDPANGNSFCSLIGRDANGEVSSDPANPQVTTGNVNGFAEDFEGITAAINYATSLDGLGLPGRLSVNANGLYLLNRLVDTTGVSPSPTHGEIGDPIFSGQLRLDYSTEQFGIGTTINYFGEEIFDRTSRGPTPSEVREFDTREAYVEVDLNLSFRTSDDFRFNFVVNNLFDRNGQEEFGSLISVDDPFGRSYSVSITKDF